MVLPWLPLQRLSVQLIQFIRSVVSDSLQLHGPQHARPRVHHQLLEFTQTHVHRAVMPSSHLILCCPLLLLPSIFPSIGVFSNESALPIRWPKDWSVSFSISPSSESLGLISFRMDWSMFPGNKQTKKIQMTLWYSLDSCDPEPNPLMVSQRYNCMRHPGTGLIFNKRARVCLSCK